jgi:hypothetical protein
VGANQFLFPCDFLNRWHFRAHVPPCDISLPLLAAVASAATLYAEPIFYRAVNLGGEALTIDGHAWAGKEALDLAVNGSTFENQNVALKPPTDSTRAQMIRSSQWGNKVDVTFLNVPAGSYQVFVYVWEDNHSEQFRVFRQRRGARDRAQR